MSSPIGFFDSGLGGISIWRAVTQLLPAESTLYYADSGHCPYGHRPHAEVRALSHRIVNFLVTSGCKLIVVACNTATAAAIDDLRATYPVPIVGIEPAVKPAALATRTGSIGILATKGTLEGELFQRTRERYAHDIDVHMQVGTGLVDIVEQSRENEASSVALLRSYIQPMLDQNVDQLVLGCTHYPFLIDQINHLTQGRVHIIDPAMAVARQVKRLLDRHRVLAGDHLQGTHQFFTSGDPAQLQQFLQRHTALQLSILPDPLPPYETDAAPSIA